MGKLSSCKLLTSCRPNASYRIWAFGSSAFHCTWRSSSRNGQHRFCCINHQLPSSARSLSGRRGLYIYDNSYRQEAADSAKLDWAKIDPSLHAQCFTGMAISSEGWCSLCHSVEHLKHNCPLNSQVGLQDAAKRPALHQPPAKRFKEWPPICRKFNKHDGYCEFMPKCNYRHVCLKCHGPHPETRCQMASGQAKPQ